MAVSLRFICKGLGDRHEEIELLFWRETESRKARILHKREGQGAEGLGFANAESQKEIVVGSRLIRRHFRAGRL
ncbi:MAG TPA: hypothetical protein VLE03_07985 [Nitrospiraceae bacterium]|nr:hypothetical protein [Nitrospiraceae bacterium]